MKTQIKFQKILALVSLIIAALVFVYALIFNSGNLSDVMFYNNYENINFDFFEGTDSFCDVAQVFVSILIIIAIVYIVVVATLFLTASNKRRNYYITNYIAIGVNIAVSAIVALFGIIFIAILMATFYGLDWESLNQIIEACKATNGEQAYKEVSKSPAMFIIGIVIFLLALANAAAWTYNLIWKIKLMKGEKELLASGLVREVA